eukprot:567365-Pyramimonas_sp.AAC.2
MMRTLRATLRTLRALTAAALAAVDLGVIHVVKAGVWRNGVDEGRVPLRLFLQRDLDGFLARRRVLAAVLRVRLLRLERGGRWTLRATRWMVRATMRTLRATTRTLRAALWMLTRGNARQTRRLRRAKQN